MEPALKQRLIGAAVLVALAVIFLPMLIKGPAPESGVADVPLEPPAAPKDGAMETRELPLLEPAPAPDGGALAMPAAGDSAAPSPSGSAADDTATGAAASAAGDWAVTFGSYATAEDAARVVEALQQVRLPGYQEAYTNPAGRALHRVRIGPFASQAQAEAARVRAAAIRSDVKIQVIALDAAAGAGEAAAASSSPAPTAPPQAVAAEPLPSATPATAKPTAAKPEPARPAEPATADKPALAARPAASEPARPAPAKPAAAEVGFAVQVGAFGDAAEAAKMRDRLRAAGFSAFTETVRTERGTLNRVRVGPVGSRAEAEQLKAQVTAKAGVDGIVRPHP
ncbi:SPOR domain-containing protein [Vulcaniibacterium thermophilum]|uniref:Sporulation protein n=1 Tax=Vulcaniibacterium thermophilum TaxID=1169913 RepID=A0A918YY67_9GAMM|nr:SPOR domain-containing protein [Vulcaniibacterium thermophilum]GHE28233.1 sporulation protein [Vulcaniibacterium thermophilum]